MYSNNILNFQESTTILNACTKKSGNLLKAPRIIENNNFLKLFQRHLVLSPAHGAVRICQLYLWRRVRPLINEYPGYDPKMQLIVRLQS